MNICNWTAKRAGGRITITGERVDNFEEVKIVGVDRIVSSPYGEEPKTIIAVDKYGNEHRLV